VGRGSGNIGETNMSKIGGTTSTRMSTWMSGRRNGAGKRDLKKK